MKTILAFILITVWIIVLTVSLIDWTTKAIEKKKLSNMPQSERLAYMQEKYGKLWQDDIKLTDMFFDIVR